MRDFFKKNILALSEYDPELCAKLKACYDKQPVFSVQPAIEEKFDQFYKGLKNPALMVWLGIGDFSMLVRYLTKSHPNQAVFILVEESLEKLVFFLSRLDVAAALSRGKMFIVGKIEHEKIPRHIRNLNFYYDSLSLGRSVQIYSPIGKILGYYQVFLKQFVTDLNDQLQVIGVPPMDSLHGYMNLLSNWEKLNGAKLVDGLKGKFRNLPGIIVSTGPSLKYRLDVLKSCVGKAIIYCADSALSILLDAGIKPDFVGALERTPEISGYFSGLENSESLILLTTPYVSPMVWQNFKGTIVTTTDKRPSLHWFYPDTEVLNCGNSVAIMGLGFMDFVGASPVYLFGQDLAYDPASGLSHSDGMRLQTHYDDSFNISEEIWVEGNCGKPVRSIHFWKNFGKQITDLVVNKNLKCFNVIEESYGAKIYQVERMDPERFSAEILHSNMKELFEENIRGLPTMKSDGEILRYSLKCLNDLVERCAVLASQISDMYVKALSFGAGGLLDLEIEKFLRNLENECDALKYDELGLYSSLIFEFVCTKNMMLARESYEMHGRNLSNQEKLKRYFDMSYDWIDAVQFWAKVLIRYIDRKILGECL